MPIKPEHRFRYPAAWPRIRAEILSRAGDRCECRGECGRHQDPCQRANGASLGPQSPGRAVVLTIAHLDHVPENVAPENLRAYCQRCHLAYDQEHHLANAAETRSSKALKARRAAGETWLFEEAEPS